MQDEFDFDSNKIPKEPEKEVKSSRRGRRARPSGAESGVDDTAPITKSPMAPNLGAFLSKESKEKPGGADVNDNNISKKSGWDDTPPKQRKSRKSITDVDSQYARKTVVGGDTADDIMVIIPDLMDGAEDEIDNTIATAPFVRPNNLIRSMGELENEMAGSENMLSQMNANSIPGIDISRLISTALCPLDQMEEPDVHWDWDIVFNQVASLTMQTQVKG